MKVVSSHRKFVVASLSAIDDGAHADVLLQEYTDVQSRAAAQHLLLGILRWRGSLDDLIGRLVRKSPKRTVRNLLRLGVFELFFCHTPNHAVIDQTVELCKQLGRKHDKGFVNAVLRKASTMEINKHSDLNVPEWLLARWKDHPDWLAKILLPPKMSLCWKTEDLARNSIIELLPAHIKDHRVDRVYHPVNLSGSPTQWPSFKQGHWWMMNVASAYAIDLIWNSMGKPDEYTVLDCCSAPGGKSFRLASTGGRITATDVSVQRLQRMHENIQRIGYQIHTEQHNWVMPNRSLGEFDLVLVDAPCSGTGVVRKHPEIKWRRTEADIRALSILQKKIVGNAAKHVRKHGFFAYSVCSVLPEEGRRIVEQLQWPIVKEWTSFPTSGEEDGFQVYVLQRE